VTRPNRKGSRRAVNEPGARIPAIDPNVVERSALYLGLVEIVDAEARPRRASSPRRLRRNRHAR
jgi:hypothetical protein